MSTVPRHGFKKKNLVFRKIGFLELDRARHHDPTSLRANSAQTLRGTAHDRQELQRAVVRKKDMDSPECRAGDVYAFI